MYIAYYTTYIADYSYYDLYLNSESYILAIKSSKFVTIPSYKAGGKQIWSQRIHNRTNSTKKYTFWRAIGIAGPLALA